VNERKVVNPPGNGSLPPNTLILSILLRRLLREKIITRPFGLKQMIFSRAMLAKWIKSADCLSGGNHCLAGFTFSVFFLRYVRKMIKIHQLFISGNHCLAGFTPHLRKLPWRVRREGYSVYGAKAVLRSVGHLR
jgi:hypothetical protein